MKWKALGIAAAASFMLAACGGADSDQASQENSPKDVKQLVHDYSVGKKTADSASITSEQLIVEDGKDRKVYSLPKDEFFVSIAPYVHETHP